MFSIDELLAWPTDSSTLHFNDHIYHHSPAPFYIKQPSHVHHIASYTNNNTTAGYPSIADELHSPLPLSFHSHPSPPTPTRSPNSPLPPPHTAASTVWAEPTAIDGDRDETVLVSAELQSCLSFDPQLLIQQLTVRPLSPAELEPRKRKRIPGLTKQQRKERLKQQHREIDARRRRREQSAIERMHRVLYNNSSRSSSSSSGGREAAVATVQLKKRKNGSVAESGSEAEKEKDDDDDENGEQDDDDEEGQGREDGKRTGGRAERWRAERVEKGMVLERAVEYMERMHGVLQQMAAHSSTQQRVLRQLVHSRAVCCSSTPSLACLPPAFYHRIESHINSQQLGSATFVSASAAMMVVSLVNGCVVDVNERLLLCTGWERQHLVARMIMAPYAQPPSAMQPGTTDWDALREQQRNRILVDGPSDCGMVPAGYYEQPAASLALLVRLLVGELRSVTAVWRTVVRSGRVVDVLCRSWAGGEVDVLEASGSIANRPAWLASVYDLREILHETDG